MSQGAGSRQALLVLVGITATADSVDHVSRFFAEHGPYAVFVPQPPFRSGIRAAAEWLKRYLQKTALADGPGSLNVLAYIGGGALLRYVTSTSPLPQLARVVYVRGPIQELVPGATVRHYGRLLARLMSGRTLLDLADGWPAALPFPPSSREQGLIIEQGTSRLARTFGLGRENVAPSAWDPARLLPGASDVLRRPESHDEVYVSEGLLSSALTFFQYGHFRAEAPLAALS